MSDLSSALLLSMASASIGISISSAILYATRRTSTKTRTVTARSSTAGEVVADPLVRLAAWVAPHTPLVGLQPALIKKYEGAGRPGDRTDDGVLGVSLLVGLGVSVPVAFALLLFAPALAPAGFLAVAAGPFLLGSNYEKVKAARQESITRTMPFMLDLLILALRAGASFEQALERVAIDYAELPLGDEVNMVLVDLATGATLTEALKGLGDRVPVAPVRVFVDSLIQGEELGRPLADVMDRLATKSRTTRVQDAEELAGKAQVAVLVPGMLVFIASLILLLAPFLLAVQEGGPPSP